MKGIYLVAVLSVAALSVALDDVSSLDIYTECPEVDPIDRTVHLPHETDCTKFYTCSMGRKIEMSCPIMDAKGNKLHFNSKLQICDLPKRAKCVRPISTSTTVANNLTTIGYDGCTDEKEGRKFRHDSICSMYYECLNGRKYLKYCMGGLHFNVILQTCEYPDKKCDLSTTALFDVHTSTPVFRSNLPAVSTNKVRLPHECSCTYYYEYIRGMLVRQSCPDGLHYDYVRQACDRPFIAKCVRPKPLTMVSTESATIRKTSYASTFKAGAIAYPYARNNTNSWRNCPSVGSSEKRTLPHEYDCASYYLCADGERILRACPANLHYDYKREACGEPETVKCVRPITESTETIISIKKRAVTQVPSLANDCSGKSIGSRWPHENNCSRFHECTEEGDVVLECRKNLHFNAKLQICDFPENAKCDPNATKPPPSSTTTTTTSTTTTTTTPTTTTTTTPTTTTTTTTTPTTTSTTTTTPTTTSTATTTPTTTSTTTTTPTTTSTTTSSVTPVPDSCPPRGSTKKVRLPHECSCTYYYECINGLPVRKRCPKGEHYDYVKQNCGDPATIKCVRPIPPVTITTESTTVTTPTTESTTLSTTTTTTNKPDICPPKGSTKRVVLPHRRSCTRYYECIDGNLVGQKCPEGMHYDYLWEVCDYPTVVNCVRPIPSTTTTTKTTTTSTTTTTTTTTTKKPITKPTVKPPPIHHKCRKNTIHQIPHENNCRLYYVCFFGTRFLQKCPRDWRFNPKVAACDHPENVRCPKFFKIEQAAIELPITCIGTCPSQDPSNHTVLLPNVDCKKFCMCSHGSAYVHDCPADLHFDSITKVCDYSANVVCAIESDSQDAFRMDREDDEDGNSLQSPGGKNEDERKTRGSFWSWLPFVGRYL